MHTFAALSGERSSPKRDLSKSEPDEESQTSGMTAEDEGYDEDVIDEEPHADLPPVDIPADTFGMSICSMTRDGYFVSRNGLSVHRAIRLSLAMLMVLLTIVIQIWLLMKVKQFVCAKFVHDIRIAYDKFELAIYGEENCTLTVNGKHRGIPGREPPLSVARERLSTLSEDEQSSACRIPFSQPYFFGTVLLIWTARCIFELRNAYSLQMTLMMLRTTSDMKYALKHTDDEEEDPDDVYIRAMTLTFKIGLTILTFIPRVFVCLFLLWVGCRWLLATTAFSDLILNAVALEFIMDIKEGLYNAFMPFRNKRDLDNTKIQPYPAKMAADVWTFINTVAWLIVAFLWVVFYMGWPGYAGFQQVLPGYNWDVHAVCTQWILDRYEV
jgi:hypothetical protein